MIITLVTAFGEFQRRSDATDVWLTIPDDAEDDYVVDAQGGFVLDPYGRKKPATTLSVSWMGPPHSYLMDRDTWISRKLAERFNLDLTPVLLDPRQYDKKKPLMFCGGNIPDLCWINDPVNLQKDVDNGFLVELSYELLQKHAPTLVKYVNTYCPHGWAYALHNGRLYGIPTVNGNGMRPKPGIWRADWLRNVGFIERDAEGRPIPDSNGQPTPRIPETSPTTR